MARACLYVARNGTEKLMLLLIANYADEDGVAFPSQERLARDGSVDARTVSRALQGLEETGAIKRERRSRDDGSRTSDRIILLLGRPDNLSGRQTAPTKPLTDNLTGGGAPAESQGGPVTESGHEPIKEPIEPVSARARDLADRLWQASPKAARKRSGKDSLARACEATLKRGADPDAVCAAAAAYYADDQQTREESRYAMGVHRLIEQDRWREWATTSADDSGLDAFADVTVAPSPARVEQITARAHRAWMEDWSRGFRWDEDVRGPAPGQAGCRVGPDLQREFGATPYGETP